MGQELETCDLYEKDRSEFKQRLREETKILKRWFDQNVWDDSPCSTLGLEVEAWLIDQNKLPFPGNDEFLHKADNSLLVHELSAFNFEMNVDPVPLQKGCFEAVHNQLRTLWGACESAAKDMSLHPLLIGILPTIRDEMLSLDYMTKSNRYRALNDQLFKLRSGRPLHIQISHLDELNIVKKDIMLEAAATSIQVHIQVTPQAAARVYNASCLASAPMVALSANSPFLYGRQLWDETRVPVFEQTVKSIGFPDQMGNEVGRVSFGSGYSRHGLLEYFLENLDGYPPLLPLLFDQPPEDLAHLKLQNGTIWRWNRPIVGTSSKAKPHLRIEQRVMASGPSLVDIVANMAFSVGLTKFLASLENPPENELSFSACRENFYSCAKSGLDAEITWQGKPRINVQELLLDELIPQAKTTLLCSGIDEAEVSYYLDEILRQRVINGQNGASWQKSFVNFYGKDFQGLTEKYLENQHSQLPVHQWTI